MSKGNSMTLLALAGVGAATGGFALPALSGASTGFSLTSAISTAGTLLSAGSSYLSGQAQKSAYESQRAQAALQLEADKTQAAIDEENRQRRLRSVLSTQTAIFGASNIDGSGVGNVIENDTVGEINRQTKAGSLAQSINEAQSRLEMSQLKKAGNAATTGGIVRAGGSLLSFAGQQIDSYRTGGKNASSTL